MLKREEVGAHLPTLFCLVSSSYELETRCEKSRSVATGDCRPDLKIFSQPEICRATPIEGPTAWSGSWLEH